MDDATKAQLGMWIIGGLLTLISGLCLRILTMMGGNERRLEHSIAELARSFRDAVAESLSDRKALHVAVASQSQIIGNHSRELEAHHQRLNVHSDTLKKHAETMTVHGERIREQGTLLNDQCERIESLEKG